MTATVVSVNATLDVEVSGRRASGEAWRAKPDELGVIASGQQRGVRNPMVRFQNEVFEWRFAAGAEVFSGFIRSKRAGSVCFLLEEAVLSSNFQLVPVPLRVNIAWWNSRPVKLLAMAQPKSNAPKICTFPATGEINDNDLLRVGADLTQLFPSGKMFNVGWRNNQPTLIEKGIGNWLKIRMPIEYEGIREEIEFKLIAKDTVAYTVQY